MDWYCQTPVSLFVQCEDKQAVISTCCIAPKARGDETVLISVDRRIVDGE